MKSMVLQNSPAILPEKKFENAFSQGTGAAQRRKRLLPLFRFLVKLFPRLPLPISLYLNYKEIIDTKEENRRIEEPLVRGGYLNNPDFNKWNSLSAIMSLVLTPPPNPLSELTIPTMFLISTRAFTHRMKETYSADFLQLRKRWLKLTEVYFGMVSHPKEVAKIICSWFNETL